MPCALIRLCLSEFASLDTDESGEITLGTFVSWAVEKNQERRDLIENS